MSDAITEISMPPGAVRLPSGGFAVVKDVRQATGKTVRKVRACMDEDGVGSMLNKGLAAALGDLVTDWQFPSLSNVPLPYTTPTVFDLIPGDDMLFLEGLVRDWVMDIAGMQRRGAKAGAESTAPGSPSLPESA